jgi:hypothetical protein
MATSFYLHLSISLPTKPAKILDVHVERAAAMPAVAAPELL